MVKPGGLDSAMASAVGGVRRAQALADRAASDVARAGIDANNFGNAASVQISQGARALASGEGASNAPSNQAGAAAPQDTMVPDIAEAMVNMNIAKHVHAANVRVLQTADEMSRDLERLVGPERK